MKLKEPVGTPDILHRYEPTDYADNNLQCRCGPFPGIFWHGIYICTDHVRKNKMIINEYIGFQMI